MSFHERLKKLNTEQRQAVETIEGAVMVIAGPGSGKTELLGLRVANILDQQDIFPKNILCLTFTDAAAKNMRERLFGLIGVDAYKVSIHTFHTFALSVMSQFKEVFYDAKDTQVADAAKIMDIISSILSKLPLSDAFSKKNFDGSYIYLKNINDRISKLKKAGISPDEFDEILHKNSDAYKKIEAIVVPFFSRRVSKKMLEESATLLDAIYDLEIEKPSVGHAVLMDYKTLVFDSLRFAIESAYEKNSTKPLTAWKNDWIKKDPKKNTTHLKDSHQLERNRTLAYVYKKYNEAMHTHGYIDFQDMIIDVITAMEENPGLLSSLQEQYQYVMVDEFQDTNDAQMRIITLLTKDQELPNIMVVGDDDQAIFKFQGAEINNVLTFSKLFPYTTFITLIKNYRSTNQIVDFASDLIKQGEDRLENIYDHIQKDLTAANPSIIDGHIISHTFETQEHEYAYIAQEAKRLIAAGASASEIAIIAKNHRHLAAVATYLEREGVAIQYERQRNVLQDVHIRQLITVAQLIESIAKNGIAYQNDLMPQVLQFRFFGLDRKDIWKLSKDASQKVDGVRIERWIDLMLVSDVPKIKMMGEWLLLVAAESLNNSLDIMVDYLVGPKEIEPDSDVFVSPFRSYYFSQKLYDQSPREYLTFLSGLRTFLDTIQSHAADKVGSSLADLVDCVKVYEDHELSITDTSPYLSGVDAVQLLSAHKSKGLEFETVFVVNCQNGVWAKSQSRDLIAFPKNLPIDPTGETDDDHLRLFFVAITRAKRQLYLTSFTKRQNGRDELRVPYLTEEILQKATKHGHVVGDTDQLCHALEQKLFNDYVPFTIYEKVFLQPFVERYTMSVTHLNNFLDVTKGGPMHFFEMNLVQFPQAKNDSMRFGTAMHKVIEVLHHHLRETDKIMSLDEIKVILTEALQKNNVSKNGLDQLVQKGMECWKQYLLSAVDKIQKDNKIEIDFKQEEVHVKSAHITGKIDKMIPNENKEFVVVDFKTGAPKNSWKASEDKAALQLHKYKQQLIFYKLLVEGSRNYADYRVYKGELEFLAKTDDGVVATLGYEIVPEDVVRVEKLIDAVYSKIKSLDFPDISEYPETLAGVIAFEDDLISGSV